MIRLASLAACLVFGCGCLHAQQSGGRAGATAQQAAWTREPTQVFGFKFGEVLSPRDLPKCAVPAPPPGPPMPAPPDALTKPGPCVLAQGDMVGGMMLTHIPIREFESGYLLRRDEIVTGLLLTGKHSSYGEIKRILIELYGPPTQSRTSTFQTSAGATLSFETSIWRGDNLMLSLLERAGKVEETVVNFSHIPSLAKSSIDAGRQAGGGPAKM